MKKTLSFVIVIMLLFLIGCTKETNSDENIVYVGKSDSWLGTYTVSKIDSIYYDSLVIQYIFDENVDPNDEIGKIEYELIGNSMKRESTYPQKLEGVAYFHVGSRLNAEMFKVDFEDEIKLTIKWKDKKEIIDLIRLQ